MPELRASSLSNLSHGRRSSGDLLGHAGSRRSSEASEFFALLAQDGGDLARG